jgi:hypothetical protein
MIEGDTKEKKIKNLGRRKMEEERKHKEENICTGIEETQLDGGEELHSLRQL